ncbi:hypothetical protein [Streptomyces sp. NPDC055186]
MAPRPEKRVTVPDGRPPGRSRGLPARSTAATIDQALMAALPARFSLPRRPARSGRTVTVDEIHALTPARSTCRAAR